MSTILILAPVIIGGGWPAISAAVAGAAVALGFTAQKTAREVAQGAQVEENVQNAVEIDLADSEVLAQNLATNQQIVLTKGSIRIVVERDVRGRCKVCASGKGHSKAELKQTAEEFTQKLTQCFVYNKVMKELKSKNFQVVNEEVTQDDSIRIHVRRWAD
jgi:ABC-type transporter MlaC component